MKDKERLFNRALRFLSFRARSEKEVSDYLKKILAKKTQRPSYKRSFYKKSSASSLFVRKIITKLKKLNLINDQEFVQWWIEQRRNLNPKGKRVLKMELRQKGVDDRIINQALVLINPNEQEKSVLKIINKKIKLYSQLSELKLRKKLFSLLLRRGFDYQLTKKVIDERLEKR